MGLGRGGTGCCVNREFWAGRMKKVLTGLVYMSAGGVDDLRSADQHYIRRLCRLARAKAGRHVLLAFDKHYRLDGSVDDERTEFYTPNGYIFDLCRRYSDIFIPSCSVHPYRSDWREELHTWYARGVRLVKWLPNAMGIDPSHERCVPFYQELARLRMVLLCHCGHEKAVEAEAAQFLGNPLLLRSALEHGATVIIAHCASLGSNRDLDHPNQPLVDNFQLCIRLLDEPRWRDQLFADISATVLFTRARVLRTLLNRTDLHCRLINGSDYPLPAIDILVRTSKLVDMRLLRRRYVEPLNEIYDFNPLLFDTVLKRVIRSREGNTFPLSMFQVHPSLDLVTPWLQYLASIPPL